MISRLGFTVLALALLAGLPCIPHVDTVALAAASDGETAQERQTLRERWRNRNNETGPRAINAPIDGAGDYSFSIVHDGLTRKFRVHVPSGYSPSKPTPMLVSFHGGGGNMDYQADDKYYGQISKSEQAGYIAVFPNGFSKLKSGKLATWNAGHCCGGARDENADDVGFVKAVIDMLSRQLNIDPKRIFATGFSNGGLMSYRLACEMSDTFRAIAPVAGTDNTRTCAPKTPISVLHIHARDDEMVLYHGGAGRERDAVTSFVSVPDTIAKWVRLNGCHATPKRVLDVPGAYCDAYTGCRGDVTVKLCVTETGGHAWPGGRKVRTGEAGSTAISANDIIWEFFSDL